MTFKFTEISTELALEIIRLAATPEYNSEDTSGSLRPYYTTALSLASVSYAVRRATMPYLLHTVILSSFDDHVAFIQSILLQQHLKRSGSRLALDYSRLVRKFWSSDCWEPVVDQSPQSGLNYSVLYEIIRSVESIGMNFRSLHLLFNSLSSSGANPSEDWLCRRVTFAGPSWRWRPLTSTPEGLAFLRQITHLVLWIPSHDVAPSSRGIIPTWVNQVPFASMLNLMHFACPLLGSPAQHQNSFNAPTEMVVYSTPSDNSSVAASTIQRWLSSSDPLAHGVIIPFCTPILLQSNNLGDLCWERAYLQGEADGAWQKAEQTRSTFIQ